MQFTQVTHLKDAKYLSFFSSTFFGHVARAAIICQNSILDFFLGILGRVTEVQNLPHEWYADRGKKDNI